MLVCLPTHVEILEITKCLLGAMWIRRSFGDDQLYTTLVQSYIDTLLQNGYNFECFVGMYKLSISGGPISDHIDGTSSC
jgi:hypothetical protein